MRALANQVRRPVHQPQAGAGGDEIMRGGDHPGQVVSCVHVRQQPGAELRRHRAHRFLVGVAHVLKHRAPMLDQRVQICSRAAPESEA